MIPADLRYTVEHEWVKVTGERTVRIGITHFAQDALGDVVFVTLPKTGSALAKGQSLGEVESTKSVSDLFAPLSGTVTAVNDALDGQPELVNRDPYGEGWMIDVELAEPASEAVTHLLDAQAYERQTSGG